MDGETVLFQEKAVDQKREYLASDAQPKQAALIQESDPCHRESEGAEFYPRPGKYAYSGASKSHIKSQAVPSAISESRYQAEALQQDPQVQWLQVQEGEDQEHAAEEGQALQDVC